MTAGDDPRFRLLACLLALAIMLVCCLHWGCARSVAAAVVDHTTTAAGKALPAAPAPTSTADADAQLKQAHAERDSLADQLDAKDRRISRLEEEERQLHDQDLAHRFEWFSGIALICTLAFVGLWFVLPTGLKSWAVYGGLACIAISAAAIGLAVMVPYREVCGLGMLAICAAFGLWKLARVKGAGVQAANAFDKLEEAFVGMKDWIPTEQHRLVDDLVANVKHEAATAQAAAGVRGVLAAIRGRDPKAPTVAPLPPVNL